MAIPPAGGLRSSGPAPYVTPSQPAPVAPSAGAQGRAGLARALAGAQMGARVSHTAAAPVVFGSPLQGKPHVTSPYGMRTHPILKTQKMHTGIDYGVPTGTPVYATAPGFTRTLKNDPITGNMVIVEHPGQGSTRYLHLDKFAPGADKGGWVKQGDQIGTSGNTGRSTGAHLHYGHNDPRGRPTDPSKLPRLPPKPAIPADKIRSAAGAGAGAAAAAAKKAKKVHGSWPVLPMVPKPEPPPPGEIN